MTREDIKETKEVISKVVFTADDGTEFIASGEYNHSLGKYTEPTEDKINKKKEQCEEYEQTTKFIFKKRFVDKAVRLSGIRNDMADWLIGGGNGNLSCYLYKVENEQDITNIECFLKSEVDTDTYYLFDDGRKTTMEVGKTYLIALNYEGEYIDIVTEEELLRRVNIAFHGEPEKKEEDKSV